MGLKTAYRRKSLGTICVCALGVAAGVIFGIYYLLNTMLPAYVGESGQAALVEFIPRGIELLTLLSLNFYQWVVPAVVGGALILGLLFWLILWLVVKADLGRAEKPAPAPQGKKGKKDFLAQKMEQERKRRLFLHTLSVLQREGRLLDFFAEDLNQYEDDQIGAAVRSIQDDCKRAVKKYINPVPVIDKEEGDAVTIEPGFDMDAIALVGNVTGEPPFEGILRHPGWKAAKKELPKLSDIQDPGIMVPAEVEIQ